ncbi:hypothetical protein JM16_002539 [Phytophthora kernoviae]|uniref:Uncharacterized protein n=1 Tax=Phytophthora kernoviae TaxID=325452 RepID=A0A8T0M4Y9_9STRA|nr:hypothetical protein JM16_002539 [Phytophthora kernoviae]
MYVVTMVLTEQTTSKCARPARKRGDLFGYLGDLFGRRVNMIVTCAQQIFDSILCTAAHDGSIEDTPWFLVATGFILDVGTIGEYPLTSSTTEDSISIADRNKRVALTSSLYGVGLLNAAILGNLTIQALADARSGRVQPQGAPTDTTTASCAHLMFFIRYYAVGVLGTYAVVVLLATTSLCITSPRFTCNVSWWIITGDNGAVPGARHLLGGHEGEGCVIHHAALFLSIFGPNTCMLVMPTKVILTPIRSTCHGLYAAAGKAGAAIDLLSFSIWVGNETFGYDGAFYTFAGYRAGVDLAHVVLHVR